ncbi:type II toxin-antitoxin system RelE/ParE family toxin [Treponema sp.]|uniref:type II toxin-antitoxin system RelE/ParE family toxin n=1 Tax=Treponema sp. TaxID=166 RepID=UPI0025F5ACB8|nr:type II toxin-antitoxin system RelE/ParE family toxin [Treponema sp.]
MAQKLKDNIAKIAIVRRLGRLENGNFGDSKFVGDSVFELRIDVGKGYRIYFTNKEKEIVILLVDGEKSTQDEDIKKAKEMAKEV